MKRPLFRVGSNCHDSTYMPEDDVRKVLKHLDAGQVAKAKKLLRALCPDIPELPPFKII